MTSTRVTRAVFDSRVYSLGYVVFDMSGQSTPFGDLERLFDEFTTLAPSDRTPAVDVVDTDDSVLVFADMPGRDVETIEVNLEKNRRLTINADGRETESEGRYVTRERSKKAISRTVSLPAMVDDEEPTASYDDGVLRVALPKQEATGNGTNIPVE